MIPADYPVILDEMALLGLDLARALHADAMAGNTTVPEAAAAFERIARAVRRTILVAGRVRQTTPVPEAAKHAADRRQVIRAVEDAIDATTHPAVAPPGTQPPERARPAAEAVSRAMPAPGDSLRDDREPVALLAELYDRIDRPEFAEDLLTRPVEHVISDILQDLALVAASHPASRAQAAGAAPGHRRTPDDIARLHARAAFRPRQHPAPAFVPPDYEPPGYDRPGPDP